MNDTSLDGASTAIVDSLERLARAIQCNTIAVQALERRLNNHERRSSLSHDDVRRLDRLLPAIWATLGRGPWTARDLVVAADFPQKRCAALRQALNDHLVSTDGSLKSLGRFLAKCAGLEVAGLCLVDAGEHRGSARWRVLPVADLKPLESH